MLKVQLLGPLEVRDGERVLDIRRRKLYEYFYDLIRKADEAEVAA